MNPTKAFDTKLLFLMNASQYAPIPSRNPTVASSVGSASTSWILHVHVFLSKLWFTSVLSKASLLSYCLLALNDGFLIGNFMPVKFSEILNNDLLPASTVKLAIDV